MTDKEKILRAIEQKQQEIWPTDTGEMKPATVPNNLEQGWLNALTWMERYINSLPAEQPSEDLEISIIEFLGHIPENEPEHSETLYTYEQMQEIARYFAQWYKERMMKSAVDAIVDEDTENSYIKTLVFIGERRNALNARLSNYEYGETVKLVIIKEDEQ